MRLGTACVVNAVAAAVALFAADAGAQAYPSRPIRLIVPFPPGGTTDLVARAVAEKIAAHLGQRLVVDNRGAEGGVKGAEMLARAAPDGYTLGIATVSTIATAPATRPSIPYSPTADFTPIINIAATPNALIVNPSFPAKDHASFLAEVRRRPGHYEYASSGRGGLGHALMLLYQSATGASLLHVPYTGGGPALNSVVGGQIPLMIANLPTALPHIGAGRLRALAVTAEDRARALPETPTFKELRLPQVNRVAFYGICGPKALPRRLVDTVHAAAKRTLSDPQVLDVIEKTGSAVVANSPEEFGRQIRAEFETYKRVFSSQKASD